MVNLELCLHFHGLVQHQLLLSFSEILVYNVNIWVSSFMKNLKGFQVLSTQALQTTVTWLRTYRGPTKEEVWRFRLVLLYSRTLWHRLAADQTGRERKGDVGRRSRDVTQLLAAICRPVKNQFCILLPWRTTNWMWTWWNHQARKNSWGSVICLPIRAQGTGSLPGSGTAVLNMGVHTAQSQAELSYLSFDFHHIFSVGVELVGICYELMLLTPQQHPPPLHLLYCNFNHYACHS